MRAIRDSLVIRHSRRPAGARGTVVAPILPGKVDRPPALLARPAAPRSFKLVRCIMHIKIIRITAVVTRFYLIDTRLSAKFRVLAGNQFRKPTIFHPLSLFSPFILHLFLGQ